MTMRPPYRPRRLSETPAHRFINLFALGAVCLSVVCGVALVNWRPFQNICRVLDKKVQWAEGENRKNFDPFIQQSSSQIKENIDKET